MDIQSKWYVVTKDSYEGFEGHEEASADQANKAMSGIGSVFLLDSEENLVARIDEIRADLFLDEATA
jgi:hypothetical protein